ncbi:MAG: hypothetical protein ACM30F_06745 [Nitrospirota bacterium]
MTNLLENVVIESRRPLSYEPAKKSRRNVFRNLHYPVSIFSPLDFSLLSLPMKVATYPGHEQQQKNSRDPINDRAQVFYPVRFGNDIPKPFFAHAAISDAVNMKDEEMQESRFWAMRQPVVSEAMQDWTR